MFFTLFFHLPVIAGYLVVGGVIGFFLAPRNKKDPSVSSTTNLENEIEKLKSENEACAEARSELEDQLTGKGEEKPASLDFSIIGQTNESEKDDLKQINGIGPVIEKKLNSIGIYSFSQISKVTPALIEQIDELIGLFPGRIEREDWIEQAKKLA